RERARHMRKLGQLVRDFLKREDGPTAVEYAVMLALIIVVCITAITTLGTNANKTFTTVGNGGACTTAKSGPSPGTGLVGPTRTWPGLEGDTGSHRFPFACFS